MEETSTDGQPAWHLSYLHNVQVIVVEMAGRHDVRSLATMVEAALGEGASRGCKRLLVDATFAYGIFGTMQIFSVPAELSRLGLPQGAKVAVVFSEAHYDQEFFETVCRNRGLFVAAFHSRADGLEWLGSPS